MNNGQIGSYYDNAYLSYDSGKFAQTGQQTGVTETVARVNLPIKDAVVMASDSVSAAPEVSVGQFISNVLKEAGITQNDKTIQLVQTLLSQQQSVDKNTLTMFNRLIKMFPDADVQTIVHMKLNNIPVNQEMLAQYEQYRSNSNYLMKDLTAIADRLGDVLKSLVDVNGKEAAVRQLESITVLIRDMTGNGVVVDAGNGTYSAVQQAETVLSGENAGQDFAGNINDFAQDGQATDIGTDIYAHVEMSTLEEGQQLSQAGLKGQDVSQTSGQTVQGQPMVDVTGQLQSGSTPESNVAGNVQDTSKNIPQELLQTLESLEQEVSGLARGETKADGTFLEKLIVTLRQMPNGSEEELFKLFDKDDFKKAVRKELENALLLEPKDAMELEKVQKYYRKLQGALDNYISMSGQQTEATSQGISKTFQNMSDNLNFMQYVNEMMPYIQLPLKLLDENAHGDFYVMRNKKHKLENSGEFTAFLRLNMEMLGELDVFLKLKNSSADIAFKVEKQEVCEFILENIGRLEDGLEKKGVSLVSHVSKKEEEFSFVKDIIEGEASGVLEKYSFDMRM